MEPSKGDAGGVGEAALTALVAAWPQRIPTPLTGASAGGIVLQLAACGSAARRMAANTG